MRWVCQSYRDTVERAQEICRNEAAKKDELVWPVIEWPACVDASMHQPAQPEEPAS